MGRSVYIRFFMRNMFVFGFRFGPADPGLFTEK